MNLFRNAETKLGKYFSSIHFYFSLLLGCLISWLIKVKLTSLLLDGENFDHYSLINQFGLLIIYTVIFTGLFLGLFSLFPRIFQKQSQKMGQFFANLTAKYLSDVKKRVILALLVLAIGFCVVFFINNILPKINIALWSYNVLQTIPVELPVGLDFRIGSYRPALNLVQSNFTQITPDGSYFSIYPPFVALINIPYLLFDENSAYLLHIGFLFIATIACLGIVSLMVKELIIANLDLQKIYADLITLFLFFAILFYTLSSYSFLFVIERGQTDIFALLFALLAMWCLVKKPENIWLQVILLSMATHLKIYPAVLFLVLLRKHGWKLILPAVSINLAMLFVLGPRMAFSFIQSLTSGSSIGAGIGNRWTWIGNHSAYAFADYMARTSSNYGLTLIILWPICALIPIELWFIATYTLLRKYSALNAVLYLMVSISLMDLLPTISMDYRLVILSPAVLMLTGVILKQIIERPRWFDYFQLLLVVLILLFIGRAYTMSETAQYDLKESASFFINNKYLWSLALEAIAVWNIFNLRKMLPGEVEIIQ